MSYGARFTLTFKDIHLINEFEVTIFKKGYSGAVEEIKGAGSPSVTVKWDAGDDFFSKIAAGEAELNLLDEGGGDFRELLDVDPFKYAVTIKRDGELYFSGFNTPDIYAEEYDSLPRIVTLRFIDGLGLLKHIEYEFIGDEPERRPAIEIIKQCKSVIEWQEAKDLAVLTNVPYYENDQSSSNITDSPLDQTYISESNFEEEPEEKVDSNGNAVIVEKNETYFNVLTKIAEAFLSRVSLSREAGEYGLNFLAYAAHTKDAGKVVRFNANGTKDPITVSPLAQINEHKRSNSIPDNNPDLSLPVLRENDAAFEFVTPRSETLVEYEPNATEGDDANIFKRGNFKRKDFKRRQTGEFWDTNKPGYHDFRGLNGNWTRNAGTEICYYSRSRNGPSGLVLIFGNESNFVRTPDRFYKADKIEFDIIAELFAYSHFDRSRPFNQSLGDVPQQFSPGGWVSNGFHQRLSPISTELEVVFIDSNNSKHFVYYDSNAEDYKLQSSQTTIKFKFDPPKDYDVKLNFKINTPSPSGQIYARIFNGPNEKTTGASGDPYYIFYCVNLKQLKAVVAEEATFNRRIENGRVENGALSDEISKQIDLSGNNPTTDKGALTVLNNGAQEEAIEWDSIVTPYNDAPLRHAKLLAREILRPYSYFSRKFSGSLTHGETSVNTVFLLEEFPGSGEIFSFYPFTYEHNLRENLIEIEALQGLYKEGTALPELPYVDEGPVIIGPSDPIDGPVIPINPGGGEPPFGDFQGGSKSGLLGPIPVDICSLLEDGAETATFQLPDLQQANGTIDIKAVCSSCEGKQLEILSPTGDVLATLNCGESVSAVPSTSVGSWIVFF